MLRKYTLINLFYIGSCFGIPALPVDLTVKIQIGGGFFAELHKVLQTLIHFEKRGFTAIDIDWRDEFFPYKDGPHENGWDRFFEPIKPTKTDSNLPSEKEIISSTAEFHEIHDQVCTAPWVDYKAYHSYRQFIHQKLNQYIQLKKSVTQLVDTYYSAHLQGKKCIGVHARIARAHAWLVPGKRLPSLDDYFNQVDCLLATHADQEVALFVASDSHQAIEEFKRRYGDTVKHIEAHRSPQDQDPCIMYTKGKYLMAHKDEWHKEKHGYFGGLTTLLDCLLLARCDYIIHTASNLAFFATYYNPDIESIYLPKGLPSKECRYKNNPLVENKFLNP